MKTDELIASLSGEIVGAPGSARRRPERILPLALLCGAVVSLGLFLEFWGVRPGLAAALERPVVLAKTLLPLALAFCALPLALRAARPGVAPGLARRLIWAVPLVAIALFSLAQMITPAGARWAAFTGHSIPLCLPSIVILAMPMLGGMLLALRRGAPVSPGGCGALAGLTAAGLAAALYSLFCIEDSPLFYAVWYSLGILLAAGVGVLAGRHWLRW